ncbi:uncharacterized protein LOC115232082 isoform X2 [Octopus sinensis]|uniref:Uncharacterized protein LOC115232082 isoform X2 n=1 Tax=Octopus sinensis TaxID=2607531 RepID=A0A6P7U1I7_9MOLL|nr:uncharacterized protein LOC115232082 isoform X2 [Octopus sinensis]
MNNCKTYLIFTALGILVIQTVAALTCYYCSNRVEKACGGNFQSYLFKSSTCDSTYSKCALQKNPPLKDGWIGYIRGCYKQGALQGIDDSNGCRYWTSPLNNMTALYCFCDTDYCNSSPSGYFL